MDRQTAILQSTINQYIAAGFRVTSQTPTSAQMVRPKQFSCLIATLSLFFFGIGVLVYVFYFASLRDEVTYLTIGPTGQVQANHQDRNQSTALLIAGASLVVLLGCIGLALSPFFFSAMSGVGT